MSSWSFTDTMDEPTNGLFEAFRKGAIEHHPTHCTMGIETAFSMLQLHIDGVRVLVDRHVPEGEFRWSGGEPAPPNKEKPDAV